MAHQHSPRFLQIVDEARKRVREAGVDDIKAMVDRGNATCVAADDAGRLGTGTQKMMFVAAK